MYSKSYFNYIINYPVISGFDKETKVNFFKLINHLNINGSSTFYSRSLENWYGKNYYHLVRLVCETDDIYDYENHKCKSYYLKDEVKEYIKNFNNISSFKALSFEERPVEQIVSETGRAVNKLPENSVLRDDTNGHRKTSTVNITKILYINYERLLQAINIIDTSLKSKDMSIYNSHFEPKKERNFQTLETTLNYLNNVLLLCKNSFSDKPNIPVQYQEQGCGRLGGVWLNPQYTISEIRNYIISDGGEGSGVYDYDMSNCHFTLSFQMYNQLVDSKISGQNYRAIHGLPYRKVDYKRLKALENYLNNKNQVRTNIAVETGIGWISDVKVLIISLMYGRKNRDGVKYYLDQSPTLRELKNDIDIMVDFLAKHIPVHVTSDVNGGKRDVIVNAVGKAKTARKANKNGDSRLITSHKRLNHILLGLEAFIIQEVANRYKDKVLLLMFDGFIANEDLFELVNFPQEFEIGDFTFSVNFEQKKLS